MTVIITLSLIPHFRFGAHGATSDKVEDCCKSCLDKEGTLPNIVDMKVGEKCKCFLTIEVRIPLCLFLMNNLSIF